jgi:hypothetical protein
MTGKLDIDVIEFKPFCSGTLRGWVDIRIRQMRMVIRAIAIHEKDGRRWAQAPSKPMIKGDTVLKGTDGKPRYSVIIEFTDRKTAKGFSDAVVAAALRFEPTAFDWRAA